MESVQARTTAPRKRVRKRRRRIPSSSSSSSSSSDQESLSDVDQDSESRRTNKKIAEITRELSTLSSSSSSSLSSSSASSSSSESESDHAPQARAPLVRSTNDHDQPRDLEADSQPSLTLPSFLPNVSSLNKDAGCRDSEQSLRERFRKFWMSSIADGFKDDLEEIRKVSAYIDPQYAICDCLWSCQEPNLGQSRLALLIDSLASGANIFSSSSTNGQVNEIEAAIGKNS